MLEQVVVWAVVAVFTVALIALIIVVFQRRLGRATRSAAPGAWTGGCVDPQQSRAWSALVIDDSGIAVRSLWGKEVRYSYRWSEVDVSGSERHEMRIGVRQVDGLRVQLVAGQHLDLLLPSRNLLRYPKERVDSALAAMRRHR